MKKLLLTTALLLATGNAQAAITAPPYFGTTEYAGAHQQGRVIRIDGKNITTLYSFCPADKCGDGARPLGGVEKLPDGSLVGTTSKLGDYGAGTFFRLVPTPTGWQYIKIWGVCWVVNNCGYYGTPHGSLKYLTTDADGDFILKGECENRHRGLAYLLIISPHNGNAIFPLKTWGSHDKLHTAKAVGFTRRK